MNTSRPVIIIGAGPAGIEAAMASAALAPTILLDERGSPGGRRRWETDTSDAQQRLVRAGVDYRPGTSAWGLFPGPNVAAYDQSRAMSIDAGAVVAATGAADRRWPVRGWHLDGVLTASEMQLSYIEESLDSNLRYGVIGYGDELATATRAIERVGGQILATFETLDDVRIEGDRVVERICGATGCVDVDRVVLALGRRPDPALALQARATAVFDRRSLIDMPLLAPDGATSLPGVFVAGEAAGYATLPEVCEHGAVVGAAAARVAQGGAQSSDLRAPVLSRNDTILPIPTDPMMVICREQGIALEAVRRAIKAGACDVNDLRRRTRAGMGLSGGDVLPVLAGVLLDADPSIPDRSLMGRHRPPARPVPFRIVLHSPGD